MLADAHLRRGKSSHLSHTVNAQPVMASQCVCVCEMEPTAAQLPSRGEREPLSLLQHLPTRATATAITAPASHEDERETLRGETPPTASGHLAAMMAQTLLKHGRTRDQSSLLYLLDGLPSPVS